MPKTRDGLNRAGERRPFALPLGLCHVAWADADTLDAHLARTPAALNDRMRTPPEMALGLIRRRGYAIAAKGEALRALRETAPLPIGHPRDDASWSQMHELIGSLSEGEIQLLSLTDAGVDGICYISAPVFSPTGDVALELTLSGMPDNLGVEEIERYAEPTAGDSGRRYQRNPWPHAAQLMRLRALFWAAVIRKAM